MPYKDYADTHGIKLGLLKGKAKVIFGKDFKMSDEELLQS